MTLTATPLRQHWPGGQRLCQAREARGWSIADLAKATGLPRKALLAYEGGSRAPSAPNLLTLAAALDVTPEQLWPTAATHLGEFADSLAGEASREKWSISKLTSYLMCPARFYFAYVVGQPDETPTSPESALGHAVHAGIERIYRASLGEPGPAPAEAIRQSLAADLPHVLPDPETGEVADAAALSAEGEKLVALYAAEIAPQFQPLLVEQRTEVQVAGVPFTAVLDVVTVDGWVRDTKTAKRRPSAIDIEENLQATIYTMATETLLGEKALGVAFDYLIRNKTPVAQTYTTTRCQRDFDRLARIVEGVTEAAATGRFYPNPHSKFGCGGCPFRKQCHNTF